ncbi:MAG: hypothetical protein IJS27_05440, partial [Ruminococcus sp.]|nr:hypothetical protein [Ruminococcus sp.]
MKKRFISILLCLSLVLTFVIAASAVTKDTAPTGADYGLAKTCADGNILQCFNWKLSDIKAELPNIAKAGFTSVQTSPLQRHDGNSTWYWLYQPTGFSIGNEIGSLNDLKSLCTEADKYGVKIIVDVVANHLAGGNNGSWAGSIESEMRQSAYFHNQGACSDYNNRHDLIYKNIGMPDLNTENSFVISKVKSYVQQLKSAGVDGIRWDAAKHIGLPSEGCNFFPSVIDANMYNYGEVLEAPAGNSAAAVNNKLVKEYTDYIGITDEPYSGTITGAIRDKKIVKTKGNWTTIGVGADRLVYWGESHDTFSNGDGWTKNLTQNQIDRSYAILASRANSQALYLSRPSSSNYSSIWAGNKGSTHYTSNEVAAVNRFHNAMIGKAEATGTANNCFVICREGGAVIVSPASQNIDVTVNNISGLVPEGTYTDEVSGGKFTVTSTKITGHIGSTGIAVIDPMKFTPAPTTAPTVAPTAAPTAAPT